jgi:hypothetical protein
MVAGPFILYLYLARYTLVGSILWDSWGTRICPRVDCNAGMVREAVHSFSQTPMFNV